MEFVEQRDHFGRVFAIGTLIWGAVGLVVFMAFELGFPPHPLMSSAQRAASCTTTVPIAPSRCSVRGTEPQQLLHAYLDGAELDSSPHLPRPAIDAALKAHGAQLYKQHCATCHGATGDGAGPDACALDTQPAVHKSGVFALRTTEHEALPTDEDIFRTITRGVHGTAMPPWIVLPEADRWALVAHVKSLSKQFDEDEAPPPIDAGQPPEATADRIAAGRALYTSGGCASCHGASGRGDGLAAESLKVKPRNFTAGRFHRGSSVADIHETLVTGLDGTPMASFAKVLSADDLWNASLYVHTLVPPLTARVGAACPVSPTTLDQQELFGIRSMMRTTHQ
jgi:cytochrome c oxidase cbb3-type subunit 2